MKIAAILVVLSVIIPTTGYAQVTTNCTRIGNSVQCNSSSPVDQTMALRVLTPSQVQQQSAEEQIAQNRIYQQRQQQREQQLTDDQAKSRAEIKKGLDQLSQDVKSGVSDYLRKGQCKEAIDFALQYNEIDLATQAKLFCTAKPSTP